MVNPVTLFIVGLVTGIGGAISFTAYSYAERLSNERSLTMSAEEKRKSLHERIFGKGSTPPLERLGRGQTVNDLLPMSPDQGPPLPRVLNLKWPWNK